MFESIRSPQIVLRIGLALVFLWFGVSKFIMPQYWIDAWVPQQVQSIIGFLHISARDFIFLNAIFEILVAVSLVSGFFMRWFAGFAALFLLTVILFSGLSEVTVRDIGLMGGLIALAIWPERTYI